MLTRTVPLNQNGLFMLNDSHIFVSVTTVLGHADWLGRPDPRCHNKGGQGYCETITSTFACTILPINGKKKQFLLLSAEQLYDPILWFYRNGKWSGLCERYVI